MGDPVMTTEAPPGWYPDPWRQSWWRWWDGVAWTAYTDQWFTPVSPVSEQTQPRAGGIAILGFLVGIALSVAIDIVLLFAGYSTTDPAVLLGSSLGLWIGLGGACAVAVRRKGSGSLADLGLVPPRWADPALGLGLAIAALIAVAVIAAALEAIDSNLVPGSRSDLAEPLNGGVLGVVVVYLIAVVGAPFFEELFFRGLVQGTVIARWGTRVGLVVPALLFGLVHLNPEAGWGNVGIYLIITTVGLILGATRLLSRRLPPGMFTHATYNAILVTVALLAGT